jgi:hypothetical protein
MVRQAPIQLELFAVLRVFLWIGLESLSSSDDSGNSCLRRVEDADSGSSDERCTQASGILDIEGLNRPAKDIGLDLQPGGRARAAPATPKNFHLFVNFRDMRQAPGRASTAK